ncbi:MAG: hypothetical protein WDA26_00605 [Pusillimonas sp.]
MTAAQVVTFLAVALVLPGCALQDRLEQISTSVGLTKTRLDQQHDTFRGNVSDEGVRHAAQHVNRPWLVGKPLPLSRDVTLPLALRANVKTTLVFSAEARPLPVIAQRIARATGIPVHVRPEALLPQERFSPRLAGNDTSGGAGAVLSASAMSFTGESEPLSAILDRIGATLGVNWRYEHGRIEFYRTETRIFNLRALAQGAQSEASLGASRSGQEQGFASSSSTRLQSEPVDLMAVIKARIEPFLTRAGMAVAQEGASSLVVVTDTPEVLRQIAAYIERENLALTRRIRLVFEEITLVSRDNAEAGLDWNVVFTSARLAASAASAGSALTEAASLGVSLADGPFKGSEAMIKALGHVGQVVRRSSVPVLTLNRRPVTHAVRTTFSYIDKVQTTALGQGVESSLPTVSVSQKEETVGSLLTLIPDAQDNGQILLSMAYDNTVAQPLKSVTFGDAANPLQLQQVTIDGNGTVQQLVLQPGQPVLVSGFDRTQEEHDARRLNPGMPLLLGGSDRAASQMLKTVILITAQVEEGF